MLWIRSVLLCAALALSVSAAQAQPEGRPIRLLFQAPPACPPSSRFLEKVMTRAPRAHLAVGDEPGRTFHLQIERIGTGFHGTLRAETTPGLFSEKRGFEAPTCPELEEALALTMALSLDEEAPAPPPKADDPGPAVMAPPRPWEWSVKLGGEALTIGLPQLMVGAGIGVEGGRRGSSNMGQRIRLSGRILSDRLGPDDRRAALRLDSLETTYGLDRDFAYSRLGIYIGVQPGRLQAMGQNLSDPQEVSLTWVASTLGLRVAVLAPQHLYPHAELDLGLTVPIVKPRIVTVAPRAVVAESGGIGIHAALRLGFSFFSRSN